MGLHRDPVEGLLGDKRIRNHVVVISGPLGEDLMPAQTVSHGDAGHARQDTGGGDDHTDPDRSFHNGLLSFLADEAGLDAPQGELTQLPRALGGEVAEEEPEDGDKEYIPFCSGMIQKEVGERLAAQPGKKDYGILSILVQLWYDVEYLFTVPETVFSPPPKVKSAVVRMSRNSRTSLPCDETLFKQIVKSTFNQRRKKLRNSIQQIVGKESPLLSDPILDKRPEQLSIEEFISLTQKVEKELL